MNDTVLLFIIGMLVTAVLGSFGFSWKLYMARGNQRDDDIAEIAKRHEEDLARCRTGFDQQIQRMNQEFYEYKLHVANGFATLQHLRDSEERTQDQLRDISAKLDRLIEGRMGHR